MTFFRATLLSRHYRSYEIEREREAQKHSSTEDERDTERGGVRDRENEHGQGTRRSRARFKSANHLSSGAAELTGRDPVRGISLVRSAEF